MSYDSDEFITTHNEIMAWILGKLIDVFEAQHQGQVHQFNLTGTAGFFQLNLLPAPGWGPEAQPLPLLFSLRDLYLLGFFHDGIWHLFDDADLRNTDLMAAHNRPYWRKLGFSGGYSGNKEEYVPIGRPATRS